MTTLYCITCVVTNKMYVGITSRGATARWRRHRYDATRGRGHRLHAAIRKHGAHAFRVEPLCDYATREAAAEAEKDIIAALDLMRKGYNATAGGDGGAVTEDARLRISKALKGRPLSQETRRKLSEAHKGHAPSAETRAKQAAALTKYYAENPRRGMHPNAMAALLKANIGRKQGPRSPEHKAKIRAKVLGQRRRKRTPEERARHSQAMLKFHAERRLPL